MKIRLVRPTEQLKGQRLCFVIFAICLSARFIEYFLIETDKTAIGENVFHKILGIITPLPQICCMSFLQTVRMNYKLSELWQHSLFLLCLYWSFTAAKAGRLSAEGKRPFSRSKTCRLRTFPHRARFSAMMQVHQRSAASRRKLLCVMFIFVVSWL